MGRRDASSSRRWSVRSHSNYSANRPRRSPPPLLAAAWKNSSSFELLEARRLLSGGPDEPCDCGGPAPAEPVSGATVIPLNTGRTTAKSVWRPLDALPAARDGQVSYLPLRSFVPFTIDLARVRQELARAPMEFTSAARATPLVFAMPDPTGATQRFSVVETQVLDPELAARFPDIKTYMAQGIDDPTARARIDVNPHTGFHAMVLSERGTWAIDNYFHNDATAFVSYQKDSIVRGADFFCETVSELDEHDHDHGAAEGGPENIPAGNVLRTFRLAVTTTTSFNTFHGNTTSSVMSAVTTAVNRITGVYETELATRLQLVADTNLLFSGLDGNPVLSGGTNVSTLANNNQTFTNSRIGVNNYDVGHVFSSGSNNGISAGGIGIVGSANKARAASQTSPPSGDLFAVDYVAHEMGHQFNGRHNFSNCGGPGDSGSIANEPGSGATIMGYAGLCGSNNLQSNSHAMFNHINYNQMYPYIANGIAAVGTTVNTGNNAPTVSAGPDYTIPARTPFALVATGSDPDGDPLTFSWEGKDTGGSLPVNNTGGFSGPIVRTWLPTSSAERTIPRLNNLLVNNTVTGEVLTTVSRTMDFRVVARDNRPSGTGINFDDMRVTTFNTGAAFAVTSPNSIGLSFNGGSSLDVTWNVAGTDAAPINTSNVNIKLSLDGGQIYAITLADGTSNDGAETVQLPFNVGSAQARLKIEAVGNIYFDINNYNFVLNNVPASPEVTGSQFTFDGFTLPDAPHRLSYTFNIPGVETTVDAADLVLLRDGVPVDALNFAVSTSGGSATFTFPGFADGLLPDGSYEARLLASGVSNPGTNDPLAADYLSDFFVLAGDANHDGTVNLNDFNVMANNFGQSGRIFSQGDFNYDGTVDLADFNLLASRFGTSLGAAATARPGSILGGAKTANSDAADDREEDLLA